MLWSREGRRWRIELYGGECDDSAVPGIAIVSGIFQGQISLERRRTMPIETLCSLANVLVALQNALPDIAPDATPPRFPTCTAITVHENEVFAIKVYFHREADDSVVVTIGVHDAGDPNAMLYAQGSEFSELVDDIRAAKEESGRLCHA